TTTYRDAANTTADWNTAAGELRLFPFVVSELGSYATTGFNLSVAVSGDLAFIGDTGNGLRVLDIEDPANPVLLGTAAPPFACFDIVAHGDLVFVADGAGGLRIVDVTDPTTPTQIGNYATTDARAVAIFGYSVIVADNLGGLVVVDVTNPASPTLVSTYDTPGEALGVTTSGLRVIVADGTAGLHVVDLTNLASPTLLGSYDTVGEARAIAMDGLVALVADGLSGLHAISTSDPVNPALLGSYDTPGFAQSVFVAGDRAYVADGMGGGLQAIDITNASALSLILAYDTPGTTHDVVVDGTEAFVADRGSFRVIAVGSLVDAEIGSLGTALYPRVHVSGNLAAVASEAGFDFVDVSNPANPVIASSFSFFEMISQVVIDGSRAYVAAIGSLSRVDITDPSNPTFLPGYAEVTAYDMAVAGGLAYVSGSGGIRILDVSYPDTLVQIGSAANGRDGVFVSGNQVYGWTRQLLQSTLSIYVVDDPTAPVSAALVFFTGQINDVFVAGDRAYIAAGWSNVDPTGSDGLWIYDVADVTNPQLITRFDPPGNANVRSVSVSGNNAIVGIDNALWFLDVTNPASPVVQEVRTVTGGATSVAFDGEHAFVTDPSNLRVLTVLQSQVIGLDKEAQSLLVDGPASGILRARLTTTQSGSISLEIAADSPATWQLVTPGSTWHRLDVPGDDLTWRSTLNWMPGQIPSISDLQLEWLTAAAIVQTIADVPNDQGGWLRVNFARSGYDFVEETVTPVTNYGIWRRVDDLALVASLDGARQPDADVAIAEAFRGMPLRAVGDRVFVQSSRVTDADFPAGTWELVMNVPSLQKQTYLAAIPTAADWTPSADNYTALVITAHTTTPSIWFASSPDSAYSVDNIAPSVPSSFVVAYNTGSGNALSWDESPDEDFQYFRVYRSSNPSFTPSAGTLVHETIAAGWSDPDYDGWPVYYKVTALDYAGNESAPSGTGTTTDVGDAAPRTFALYPNVPNPFNPTTLIRYDVPASGGEVTLRIYDVSGRPVKTLVEGVQSAGSKSATWDGRDDAGRAVASGVYFYRLAAPGFTKTHKMVLMK
ncbi:MAG TPA: FlgD immunoglobulin-like domain containing protein, partial [Candidatus Krumholzibacteria bacterium]|nr:FlgD immunoglobulin-like domain containing protein [Candidatus Krumholzibacteria bacterium]